MNTFENRSPVCRSSLPVSPSLRLTLKISLTAKGHTPTNRERKCRIAFAGIQASYHSGTRDVLFYAATLFALLQHAEDRALRTNKMGVIKFVGGILIKEKEGGNFNRKKYQFIQP